MKQLGSGKPDALMRGPTIPVVCLNCNEIYDRIIHSPSGEKLKGKCEECGTSVYGSNGENVNIAVSKQGPDNMTTKLWFAK
ncbi:hypothetical protein PQZ51_01650 [Flavobacteriaceae bacterium]|nr:hypothetical protein [Flavobacteriaceae bacterium]MDC6469389.1 hypothetical protein [Flavobacteriaceae bacterium]